jgi:plastocyanin
MKLLFTLVSLMVVIGSANATVHTVTCQNTPSHFLSVTVNAVIGDTIRWTYVAGVHVVGPISAADIPTGAAMWNGPIDASHLALEYVVTVAGNYHYVCHPNSPHGEDAYIVVATTTVVQQYNGLNNVSSVYPNPFSEKITIEASNADLIFIYNCLGEKIKSFTFKTGETKIEIDLSTLPKGLFFYSIIKNGMTIETKKIFKD